MCKLNLNKGNCGLGPNARGNIRHLLPGHTVFHKSAVQHDVEGYRIGGNQDDKNYADKLFYISMLNCINELKPIKRVYYMLLASIYYLMVKFFGFMYFGK